MKNLIAATLITLLTISGLYHMNLDSADSDFERWAKQHGKMYYGDEKTYRQAIYYQNKQMIEEHNRRTDVTYLMGENQFTGITNEEFISLYLHPRPSQALNDEDQIKRETNPKFPQPTKEQQIKDIEVDWRGMVKVKNQGSCASDYAMITTSIVEVEYALRRSINVTLSAQNIVDCINIMSQGCDSIYENNIINALQQVKHYGLYTEQYYPYTGKADRCQVSIYTKGPYSIEHSWEVVPGFQESKIFDQPITTYVDAFKFQFYKSGVFSDCNSGYNKQNYYALIVGYVWGQYWIVQPSFGTSWGESGYIRIQYANSCGIAINTGYRVTLD